jgi:hypothetical protein
MDHEPMQPWEWALIAILLALWILAAFLTR